MKKCTFCAEKIQDDAIKCRFCGEFLDRPTISLGIGPKDVVDHFTVIREIGRGGMAVVYLANDESLKRKVALKVLPPHFLNDDKLCKHFQKEARLAAQITHPNIIPVYSVGQSSTGQPYFVMAYLEGGTLGQRIKNGPLSINEALKIIKEILYALDYAHENGIIHRDIKPDNILFSDQGLPIIADFGIAGAMSGTQTATNLGMNSGTPIYMSPELFKGEQADARSDIYAIGTMLYQMLIGNPPFIRADLPGIMFEHLSVKPESLIGRCEEVSPELNDVILKALEKEPENRYQSAIEFAQSLANCNLQTQTQTQSQIQTKSKIHTQGEISPLKEFQYAQQSQNEFESVVIEYDHLSQNDSVDDSDDVYATIPTLDHLNASPIADQKLEDKEILKGKIINNINDSRKNSTQNDSERLKSNIIKNVKSATNMKVDIDAQDHKTKLGNQQDNNEEFGLINLSTLPIDEKPISKVAGFIIPILAILTYFIGFVIMLFS